MSGWYGSAMGRNDDGGASMEISFHWINICVMIGLEEFPWLWYVHYLLSSA